MKVNLTLFCRRAAQKALDRERREKHRQMEQEREKVRQQLREKYNLEKPESVEVLSRILIMIEGILGIDATSTPTGLFQ